MGDEAPPCPPARSPVADLRRQVRREVALLLPLLLGFAVLTVWADPAEAFAAWARDHQVFELDDLLFFLGVSHVPMLLFGMRRAHDLKREVARRHGAQRELAFQARHDALTGLANRASFLSHARQAVLGSRATGSHVAVLLIDLDRFKEVNDTLGHDVGDALLRQVGARLAEALPEPAVVARLGGDEFAVLLPATDVARAVDVAAAAMESLRSPFNLEGVTIEIDASAGIAWAPDHGEDAASLVRQADVAMYAAKADHAGVAVYEPRLDEHAPARLALFGELRRAISAGELVLHYQPKADLRRKRVTGVEALVRWQHPERGLLGPAEFLDVAERTGLIRTLTAQVLSLALADCRAWREAGLPLTVAVNLSARSLLDGGLPDEVAALLAAYDLPAGALELEITESTAMTDPARALTILHRLHAMGVGLSVDDYGTGHSSLAYLSRLPVGTLKIDRSFVQGMELDDRDATIVRSTVELAHSLGLRVVAEGVETATAWRELSLLGCDDAQGYWLARPSPSEQVADLVRELEERIGAGARSLRGA